MKKLIVITGGSKGIGLAAAEKFAAAGFDIVLTARGETALRAAKESIEKKTGVTVHIFTADLGDRIQAGAFALFVTGLRRNVDVLVNNAGLFVPGQVTKEDDGVLEDMMRGNVYSAYHVTRGLLPLIKQKRGSHIFNLCSIASFMAYPNGGSYTITKFALLGFSKVLREELRLEGVRVTSVMPGATMTASWEGAGVAEERLMKASDVADTIFGAYSLSDRSVVEEIIIRPQLGDI